MAGDRDRADVLFEDAVAEGRVGGVMLGPCIALAERSLLAIGRGDWERGGRYLAEARSLAREGKLEDYPPVAIMYAWGGGAARGRPSARRGGTDPGAASSPRPDLRRAAHGRSGEDRLARCYLALCQCRRGADLLREAGEILVRRPGLGVFVRQAADLRAELSRARGSSALGASALTGAELRLLPMLCTHLSFPEIAEEMFLSRHTVKAEAMSIYRKLGVSSRNQAVSRARELALLDE